MLTNSWVYNTCSVVTTLCSLLQNESVNNIYDGWQIQRTVTFEQKNRIPPYLTLKEQILRAILYTSLERYFVEIQDGGQRHLGIDTVNVLSP